MNHPKNFFLQIGIIVTLYASIISFLNFIFGVINLVFPNPNDYYIDYNSSSIRYSVSVLIVIFPIFIILSRMYRKYLASDSEMKESKLRKWLLYLTLFLSGLANAIDVIVLINTFLGGESFTTSFILKVLAVFVVTMSVFYFYLKDIQGKWYENPRKPKIIAIISSIVILMSVISGIIMIGSPSSQREKAEDQRKIDDLNSLQWQITDYYQSKGRLPNALDELKDPLKGNIVPKTPDTAENYKYTVGENITFTLCATFKTDNTERKIETSPIQTDEYFKHIVGENCYERVIDKDKFPLFQSKK